MSMTPNFEQEAERLRYEYQGECFEDQRQALEWLERDIARALRAAYQKGMQEVNSQDYWEARVKEAHEESRYEALEQAAKVAEGSTIPLIHGHLECCESTKLNVANQIRCLRPEGGEAGK